MGGGGRWTTKNLPTDINFFVFRNMYVPRFLCKNEQIVWLSKTKGDGQIKWTKGVWNKNVVWGERQK